MSDLYPLIFKNHQKFESIVQVRYVLEQGNADLYTSVPKGHKTTLHHLVSTTQDIYILLEQGAQCTLSLQDDLMSNGNQLKSVQYHILLQQDAQCDVQIALLQSTQLSVEIHIYLQGSYSKALIKGMYALSSDQKITIKTFQNHFAEHTQSELVLKGMLKDRSQVFYEGLIFIGPDAKKTQASQENKNILLSKLAKVISIPSIEVLQHDVQCSHGSAIGRFEQEQLWYLQSKGLAEDNARELLIRSFFGAVIESFEDKKEIEEAVCQKMV